MRAGRRPPVTLHKRDLRRQGSAHRFELDLLELGELAAHQLMTSSRYPMMQISAACWEAEHITAVRLMLPPAEVLWPMSEREKRRQHDDHRPARTA